MSTAITVDRTNFEAVVLKGSATTPVLVDFWAPWCAPCRALAPVLDKIAAEFAGRVTLAKLNTDEEQEIASTYGVRGIPNCKLFVDGRVKDEFTGALPESGVRDFLADALPSPAAPLVAAATGRLAAGDAAGALVDLDRALALAPGDEDAALTRVEALLALGRGEEAAALVAQLASPPGRGRPVRDERRLAQLAARATLAATGSGDLASLAKRAAATPIDCAAKLDYANALAAHGDYEPALEELLAIVRADRGFGDDAGRKGMLTIFEALGADSDLARRYRRELASAINR
jgi:putative thioredoxin